MQKATCFIIGLAGLFASPLLMLWSWHFMFGIWFMLGMLWFIGWQLPTALSASDDEDPESNA